MEIDGFLCVSGGSITIVTENWRESDYEKGDSPVGGASFDPKEDKPCTLEFALKIQNSNKISIKGVGLEPPDDNSTATGLDVQNGATNIDIHYCTIQEFNVGLGAMAGAVSLSNSYLYKNTYGAAALGLGRLDFQGDNYIVECKKMGVVARLDSLVLFRAWEDLPFDHFTTEISTTSSREEYKAIYLMDKSIAKIENEEFNILYPRVAFVRILNELLDDNPKYYGVVLETASLFTGASKVGFNDPTGTINEGKPTLASNEQFVGKNNSTIVK